MLTRYATPDELLDDHPWLAEHEAENDSVIAQLLRLKDGRDTMEEAFLASDDGVVAVWCPGRPLNLAGLESPASLGPLIDALAERAPLPLHLRGPVGLTQALAGEWVRRNGGHSNVEMEQGVFELREVVWPQPIAAGSARWAEEDDRSLLAEWLERFRQIAAPRDRLDIDAHVTKLLAERRVLLWIDERPRSMAARVSRLLSGERVSLVYTPPESRERGYAAACVATLSQRILDAGSRLCCLHTDLTNATSNALYERIGYRRVGYQIAVSLYVD
ncbi:MAG: GNAT family N-acetyltransferase [Planctomycetota bacterium]